MQRLRLMSLAVLVCVVGALVVFAVCITPTHAATDVTLAWDANTEQDLAGYRVYQSTAPGVYDKSTSKVCDVDKTIATCTISGLPDGAYYWVATAYDGQGNESDFSNEVSFSADTTPPARVKGLKTLSVKVTVSMTTGQLIATATTGSR